MEGESLHSWVALVSNPNFPWRTLEGEVDYEEEEEEDDTEEDPTMVDPLRGWQRKVLKVLLPYLSVIPGCPPSDRGW